METSSRLVAGLEVSAAFGHAREVSKLRLAVLICRRSTSLGKTIRQLFIRLRLLVAERV